MGIAPYEFLLIKDLLVRECLKEGFLTKDAATNSVKLGKFLLMEKNPNLFIDFKEHTGKIFDFLVTNKIILEKS